MNSFIREYKNSLSTELCHEIIQLFENEDENNKHAGCTVSGVDTNIKHTLDYCIYDRKTMNCKNDLWMNIDNLLYSELQNKLSLYITELNNEFLSNPDISYNNFFKQTFLTDTGFMIQKYTKNVGKYVYHTDNYFDNVLMRERVITYLWYLNDVDVGGTTEFLGGSYEIKPEKGKLIFFPSCWCFPHRGNMPISNDKYIITGWFCRESSKHINNLINLNHCHRLNDISNNRLNDISNNSLNDISNNSLNHLPISTLKPPIIYLPEDIY